MRRSGGDWPGYIAEELFPATLVAVCAPAIAETLRHPRDLSRTTLIVVAHLREQWPLWFETADVSPSIQTAGEIIFKSSPMAIKAVLDGVVVAVAQLPYISDALASGRLVAPLPIVPKKYESWYLAYRPGVRTRAFGPVHEVHEISEIR